MTNEEFIELLNKKKNELFRSMPWRDDTRPYYILVSELMLQQTQVARVIPKFELFITAFPDEKALAQASLADIVKLWQGLGYNRRAKYLHDAAKMIVNDYNTVFPKSELDILRLPGVGKNTCGAILAYAYNQPSIFIETNIRTVYIHHFFANNFAIDDNEIRKKLTETIDRVSPREFYWALMDYGAWLKANGVKNIHQSKHYKKQSRLVGSIREVRGKIIRVLSEEHLSLTDLKLVVGADERFEPALAGLLTDGLVQQSENYLHLTK